MRNSPKEPDDISTELDLETKIFAMFIEHIRKQPTVHLQTFPVNLNLFYFVALEVSASNLAF